MAPARRAAVPAAALLLAALLAAPLASCQTTKGLLTPDSIRVRNVSLSDIPACLLDTAATDDAFLRGGLSGDCVLQGVLAPDET